MNRHVNAIAGRLSLRPPQRHSLEILDRVTEIVPPHKGADVAAALAAIHSEFPTVTDFEREFPSLCFALATGVGKTRLMGAFISYLHLAHGINNFFVLAPNLTIYNKLIADFTPNTPKYVFKGIAEFATDPPEIITGDNYESQGRHAVRPTAALQDQHLQHLEDQLGGARRTSAAHQAAVGVHRRELLRLSRRAARSGAAHGRVAPLPRQRRRARDQRAEAGARSGTDRHAVRRNQPGRGAVQERHLRLPAGAGDGRGFVKEPAVVTQQEFRSGRHVTPAELERDQARRRHPAAREHQGRAGDLRPPDGTAHRQAVSCWSSPATRRTRASCWSSSSRTQFFEGRYKERSSRSIPAGLARRKTRWSSGCSRWNSADEPTEIVIHVNMLKEGWDVTNLYTIVPLRAANARMLIEQSIGRGLRLPYGKRTGVAAVDRLNIVAHDKFQEIIDEANRPDSPIRLQQVILDPTQDLQRLVTVVSQSNIEAQIAPSTPPLAAGPVLSAPPPVFTTEVERRIARVTYDVIRQHENLPRSAYLLQDDVQQLVVREVEEALAPVQLELAGVTEKPDIAEIVHKTSQLVVQQSIDIPRILVVPKGEVSSGFQPFSLHTAGIHYQPVDRDLLIQHLRTHEQETLSFSGSRQQEQHLEDYLVRGLIDYDDISYDDHADLLYDLAGQMVKHLLSYLSEGDARNVLIYHQTATGRVHPCADAGPLLGEDDGV